MTSFTVVMAVYHGDTPCYVNEALESLLHQTRPASEILIVVDGKVSADMDAALRQMDSKPDVRIIHLSVNKGPGASRDVAIRQAKHNIIAIMDADDVCELSRFERQLPIIERGDAELVGSWIEEFHETPWDFGSVRKVPENHNSILEFGKWRQPVNHVSIIFTKDAYYKVGGYSQIRYVEDYDYLVRLLVNDIRFYNIPEVLVHVRLGDTLNRRAGLSYLQAEILLLTRMYRWNYLNLYQLLCNIAARLFTRLLPRKLLELIYMKTLRKKNN